MTINHYLEDEEITFSWQATAAEKEEDRVAMKEYEHSVKLEDKARYLYGDSWDYFAPECKKRYLAELDTESTSERPVARTETPSYTKTVVESPSPYLLQPHWGLRETVVMGLGSLSRRSTGNRRVALKMGFGDDLECWTMRLSNKYNMPVPRAHHHIEGAPKHMNTLDLKQIKTGAIPQRFLKKEKNTSLSHYQKKRSRSLKGNWLK